MIQFNAKFKSLNTKKNKKFYISLIVIVIVFVHVKNFEDFEKKESTFKEYRRYINLKDWKALKQFFKEKKFPSLEITKKINKSIKVINIVAQDENYRYERKIEILSKK